MGEDRDEPAKGRGAARPHRTRLSIPAADESTIRWLEAQENVSASVRYLVREHIRREGYTDPVCAPVDRQPRRGRPPGSRDRRERRRQQRQERADQQQQSQEGPGSASVQAHAQREAVIAKGIDQGWLVVDEFGEAVCVDCRREHGEHEADCWHARRCAGCGEVEGHDPGCRFEPLGDLDLGDDEEQEQDQEPQWGGPPLHEHIGSAAQAGQDHEDYERGEGRGWDGHQ